MRVFFSTEAFRRTVQRYAAQKLGDEDLAAKLAGQALWKASGYGRHYKGLKWGLERLGVEIIEDLEAAEECDLELAFGAPFEHIQPFLKPAVKVTMVEWIVQKNELSYAPWHAWTAVVTPSRWSAQMLQRGGVSCPIAVVPNGIFPYEVPFSPRNWFSEEFRILAMSRGLSDRKLQSVFLDELCKRPIPDNWRIVFKANPPSEPTAGLVESDLWLTPQIRIITRVMPWHELRSLLSDSHVSVNPTSGEGFGLIPLEHAATGMNVITHNRSGLSEYVREDLFWLVPARPTFISFLHYNAYWPDWDKVFELLHYCDEHREELAKRSALLSNYVHSNYTWVHSAEKLLPVLERVKAQAHRRSFVRRSAQELFAPKQWVRLNRKLEIVKAQKEKLAGWLEAINHEIGD